MPLFGRNPNPEDPFRKNEKVIAAEDLEGVPEGTAGKVRLVNGFDWIRYWVFFDNGVDMGSIDGEQLVRPQHWHQFKIDRQARLDAEELAALQPKTATAAVGTGGGEAAAAAADPNDPLAAVRALVPPHLLERSAAARVRLGVPPA